MGEIDELTPRQFDALIAECIMGLEVHWREDTFLDGRKTYTYPCYQQSKYTDKPVHPLADWQSIPNYSVFIQDAFKVVYKLKELRELTLELEDMQFDGQKWKALFKGSFDELEGKWTELHYAYSALPAHAICLAALKVVGYDPD